jgi:hypothetical protein
MGDHNKLNNTLIIDDRLNIDVAVLFQETTEVRQICGDHVTNLDDICISMDLFRNIFFPYSENFCINKNYIDSHKELIRFISFLPQHRTLNNKKFYLLEKILSNLENDLNVPRNCFTLESRVELTNQIIGINSLLDLNQSSILASLTWSNILEIISNYKLLKTESMVVIPILTISVIFKTPTENVENTIIRFNYKIINI